MDDLSIQPVAPTPSPTPETGSFTIDSATPLTEATPSPEATPTPPIVESAPVTPITNLTAPETPASNKKNITIAIGAVLLIAIGFTVYGLFFNGSPTADTAEDTSQNTLKSDNPPSLTIPAATTDSTEATTTTDTTTSTDSPKTTDTEATTDTSTDNPPSLSLTPETAKKVPR